MLNALRRRAETRRLSDGLLAELVTRARRPVFYERLAVADTIDGRFDVLALHAWLVLDRIEQQGAASLAQGLIDALFVHFDDALRRQGAGDVGMGRRMTKFADAFYGRLKAYGDAADDAALADAILRNVYRGDGGKVEPARELAIYAASARERLSGTDLLAAVPDFGPEP